MLAWLDVLLTTPLTTSKIVWGKWFGSFRRVPLLAILPGALAAATGLASDDCMTPILIFGYVVALGAAITSVGLALATWNKSQGRAIGRCVAIYVGLVFIPVFAAMAMEVSGPERTGFLFTLFGNPFYAVGMSTMIIAKMVPQGFMDAETVRWILGAWIFVLCAVALLFYLLTLKSFDRCLGRLTKRDSSGGSRELLKANSRTEVSSATPVNLDDKVAATSSGTAGGRF